MSLQINPSQLTLEQRREGLRQMVLIHLDRLGGRATADEIANSIKYTTGRNIDVAPRITELVQQGKIRDTKLRVRTKGRPKVVWAKCDSTHEDNDVLWLDEGIQFGKPQPVEVLKEPSWFANFGQ